MCSVSLSNDVTGAVILTLSWCCCAAQKHAETAEGTDIEMRFRKKLVCMYRYQAGHSLEIVGIKPFGHELERALVLNAEHGNHQRYPFMKNTTLSALCLLFISQRFTRYL